MNIESVDSAFDGGAIVAANAAPSSQRKIVHSGFLGAGGSDAAVMLAMAPCLPDRGGRPRH
jgi:hypothetical protein